MLNAPIYPSWMVSPGHKCQIAGIFVNRGLCSERAACRHFGLHRSTFQYEAKQPNAWLSRLKIALKRMSRLHPELGYAKSTRLLKDEGWQVGNRMVQRLRREWLGLAVPTRKPRRRRQGISTGLPTKATHPKTTSGLGTSSTTPRCGEASCACLLFWMSIRGSAYVFFRISWSTPP